MALFTGKGDNGTTKTFGCDQRISKSSSVAEALGTLDEVNSFLGLVKVECAETKITYKEIEIEKIIHNVQENLFIVQAEVAGADKKIGEEKVKEAEDIINGIEKELPPITTFFIAGGTRLASLFDIARTTARRAERRVVQVNEQGSLPVSQFTLAYLNRLSSLLYALARFSNHKVGIKEEAPDYK